MLSTLDHEVDKEITKQISKIKDLSHNGNKETNEEIQKIKEKTIVPCEEFVCNTYQLPYSYTTTKESIVKAYIAEENESIPSQSYQIYHDMTLNRYEYQYSNCHSHAKCQKYNGYTYLSNNNYENIKKTILPSEDKTDESLLNSSFSYRVFKTLEKGVDLYLNSDDLELRNEGMKGYLSYIINYILIDNENDKINTKLNEIVSKDLEDIHVQVKEDLFLNKDIEELKEIYINHIENQKNNHNGRFLKFIKEELIELLSPFQFEILSQSKENQLNKLETEQKTILNKKINSHLHLPGNKEVIERISKDKGFVKPKVLILLPNKESCLTIINYIILLVNRDKGMSGVGNRTKFKEEFSKESLNEDYFKLGINIKDCGIDLYSSFSDSNIIISSPIAWKDCKHENIFLSSIEIVLIDMSEKFIYQNLDFLEELSYIINLFPKTTVGVNDIHRIKEIYKEEFVDLNKLTTLSSIVLSSKQNQSKWSFIKNLRQVIFVSHFKSLQLESIFRLFTNNINGGVIIKQKPIGVIDSIKKSENSDISIVNNGKKRVLSIKMEFKFISTPNIDQCYDIKFNFFIKNLYQNLYEAFDRHSLIFCTSFDYYRLQRHFQSNYSSVVCISEETEKADWQKKRFKYNIGQVKFMLYSERAHVFKKCNLNIVKNLIFYSLPEDVSIFEELVSLIHPEVYKEKLKVFDLKDPNSNSTNDSAVICLVNDVLEVYQLENVVGYEKARKLIKDKVVSFVC